MSFRSDRLRASYAYQACFNRNKVLTTSAETVYEVASRASALTDRTYPFTAATVAAFLRRHIKSRSDPTGCSTSDETYAA